MHIYTFHSIYTWNWFFFFFCPAVMCMWKVQVHSYLSCMCSTHCSCFTEGHIQYFSGGALLILILYFVIPPKVVIVLSQLQCVFSAADTHLWNETSGDAKWFLSIEKRKKQLPNLNYLIIYTFMFCFWKILVLWLCFGCGQILTSIHRVCTQIHTETPSHNNNN